MQRKVVGLFLLMGASSVHSMDCSRDDVDHYLSQGFSPEQVTRLCTASQNAPASTDSMAADSSAAEVSGADAQSTPAEEDWSQASDVQRALNYIERNTLAKKWHIQEHTISFSLQTKIDYGEEDTFGNRSRVRPYIDVAVDLPSVRVVNTTAHIPLLRRASMTLSADMSFQIVGAEGYDQKALAAIEQFLEEATSRQTLEVDATAEADLARLRDEMNFLQEKARQSVQSQQ
ncbi:hypothetical protein GP5015_169 [gamma proteobacterium HTCC5015]|nr:hypothetical protein GP5015_169 [gamma proteobacterium HTCC5015]